MAFQFVHKNEEGLSVLATVREFNGNTGLWKIIQGGKEEEWIPESIIQEALLSQNNDRAQKWMINKILDHRL